LKATFPNPPLFKRPPINDIDSQVNLRITLNPLNKVIQAKKGDILLHRLQEEGVHIEALCGGKGFCGKCKVVLEKGRVETRSNAHEKLLSKEELESGFHLACMTVLVEDCEFTIPVETRVEKPQILLQSRLVKPPLNPSVSKHLVAEGGDSKLNTLLGYKVVKLEGYEGVPPRIPEWIHKRIQETKGPTTVTITRTGGFPEAIMVEEGDTRERLFGVVVDVGTTTLVVALVDLNTGDILGRGSAMNKQISYGEDLVTRIAYSRDPAGLEKLNKAVVETFNQAVEGALEEAGVEPWEVAEISAGGNTVMNHLFAGLETAYLEVANVEVSRDPIIFKAGKTGLKANPEAYVYCLPNVSRFLGGDAVGDVLVSGMHLSSDMSLMVDLGTNGEIIFGNNSWMFSCSCASGPAFEGQGLRFGMRAAEGGIDKVRIDDKTKKAQVSTIGGTPPKGICGSGLIDALAELYRVGILDFSGKLVPGSPWVREGKWGLEYVLVPAEETAIGKDVVITQTDLDYVIDSKAAACGAITVLMKKLKITIYDTKNIYLAGAFGNYTNLESAVKLGIFPEFPNGAFHNLGNGSLAGAYTTLLSMAKRREAAEIARRMVYIDLLVDLDFIEEYSKALYIPGDPAYFPNQANKNPPNQGEHPR